MKSKDTTLLTPGPNRRKSGRAESKDVSAQIERIIFIPFIFVLSLHFLLFNMVVIAYDLFSAFFIYSRTNTSN